MILRGKAAIAVALVLAGCATTGGPGVPTDTISQIRQYAVTFCGFQPAVSTVTGIIATMGGPGAVAGESVLTQVAQAICTAVSSARPVALDEGFPLMLAAANPKLVVQPANRAKGTIPKVNGVPVHGTFVK